jgi:hypothetical protein
VAPPVFKTYAAGLPRLRRVTLLANSRVSSPSRLRRVTAEELKVGTEWALPARSTTIYLDALVQALTVRARERRSRPMDCA